MPNDPKWRTISRVSGRSISEVISVYVHILVCASNATERGRTHANAEMFAEDVATALDVQPCDVASIIKAMQGRVLDGDKVTGWDKRQPQREDNSADRAKEWREKKKGERNRTQPNATERQIREEKSREEYRSRASEPEVSARTVMGNLKAATAKASANSKGSRLSIETLPMEWEGWTTDKLGWSVQRCSEVFEIFHDFWCAKSGKDATKVEWFLTWKNWCKNQRNSPPAPGGQKNGVGGYVPGKQIVIERPVD